MENYFEKQYEIRYFEINKFGEALITTLLTLLEETAADHCYVINRSLCELKEQHIGWVLLSGVMQIDRFPKYKEKITIRTWLSNYSTIKGYRENIIYDEWGNIIVRAKGLWVFFDILRRRPLPIIQDIKEKWGEYKEECCEHDIIKKIEPIHNGKFNKQFIVNRFDIDTNLHVNNIQYLKWMLESMPNEIVDNYRLHTIDGRFIAEAQYNDQILSFTDIDENKPNSFIHSIRTQDIEKYCATAKTFWKERN